MSQSIDSTPGIRRFALGAISVATEVLLPARTNIFTVKFEGNPGRLALSGTDGGPIGADYVTIDADRFFVLRLDEGTDRVGGLSVYIDSDAASSVMVQALAEEG